MYNERYFYLNNHNFSFMIGTFRFKLNKKRRHITASPFRKYVTYLILHTQRFSFHE